ncbi:MAG: type pilus assembly protein PilQ [Desulfonauticus sp.]|nr:type pilus assembly protein PilQ [Desulfonauticus sp.]
MSRVFILISSLIFLFSCAPKQKEGVTPTQGTTLLEQKENLQPKEELKAISLVKQGDRTLLRLVLPQGITVNPSMDDLSFSLEFFPAYSKETLPLPKGVVSSLKYFPALGPTANKLEVKLNKPCQFLLSRGKDNTLEVAFIPSKEIQKLVEKDKAIQKIKQVSFLKNKKGNLIVLFDSKGILDIVPKKSKENKIYLTINKASLVKNYEKIFRLEKFNTPIRSALFQNKQNQVEMILLTEEKVPFNLDVIEGKTALVFLTSDDFKQKPSAEEQAKLKESFNQQEQQDIPELNTLLPGMKQKYTGKLISIDLQDADVENVLRLLASVENYNLIIDDGVTGKISLRLYNIPWDQALDLVLLQKNLGVVIRGNIMRVATQEKLRAEREAIQKAREEAQRAKESMKKLEPLEREYIQINYTTAAELEPKVKSFLSDRGKLTADSRTNQLIVEDIRSRIEEIKSVIEKLDRPEKQVLIEARIVYATDDFQRAFGLKWSFQNPGEYYGKGDQYYKEYGASGINFPSSGPLDFSLAGQVAKVAGKDLFTLDAELKLAESQNLAKTISSPRIVTLNNQKAEITQGTKIAVSTESESGGTTVEYKDALLRLTVTPQITPDNKVILDLDISDDSPKEDDIETKTAKTKLIVEDGETIVIGGVRKLTDNKSQTRVPGLHRIPLLGWLFKNDYKNVSKQELLIFIRPKILNK